MKKFLGFLILATTLFSLSACSDNDEPTIWDIAPAIVKIQLVDEDGNNLLNPEVEGNWVNHHMQISDQNKIYTAIWNKGEIKPQPRDLPGIFYGLFWYTVDNKYTLYLGEFDGDSNIDLHLSFSIDGIDKPYQFEFKHNCKWHKNKPQISNQIIYEGKVIEGSTITLTVPRNVGE